MDLSHGFRISEIPMGKYIEVLEVFSKIYHSQHFSSSYAIVALRLIQASATICNHTFSPLLDL
jgi:hypothetical protein